MWTSLLTRQLIKQIEWSPFNRQANGQNRILGDSIGGQILPDRYTCPELRGIIEHYKVVQVLIV